MKAAVNVGGRAVSVSLSRVLARQCAVFFVSVVVGGCVLPLPLPMPHRPPYVIGENVFITVGTTTRDDVEANLGNPTASYCEGREFVYVAFEQTAELFIAGGVPNLPAGQANVQAIGRDHILRIQFDDTGVVREYDLQIAKGGWFGGESCTTSGACVSHRSLFRYAPAELDAQAKRVRSVAGRCAVYVYWEQRETGLWIDGQKAAPIMPVNAFLWFALEPGPHSFWAHRAPQAQGGVAYPEDAVTLQTSCEPGSLVFVGQAHLRDDDRVQRLIPGLMDPLQALPAIAERKLIMASDPWGAASCGDIPGSSASSAVLP